MKNFVEASTFCHLVTDGTHNSPKKTNDGVLLVTSKNITNGKLDLSKSYYISKDDAIEINKRSKVNKFDILISMIGTVGEVCFIDQEPNFVVKNVGILKNKDKFHAKWLYFYLKSQEAQNIIKERLNGTTQQYLSLGELRKLPILKPISENHLINTVEILDNFEKKITLNTQTNQTLEQIAQAIFKHWFIDFAPVHAKANALARGETIEQAELAAMACLSGKTVEKITALKTEDPTAYHQLQQTAAAFPSEFVETEMGQVPKGWEVRQVKDMGKIICGKTPSKKKEEFYGNDIPFIKIPDMHNNTFIIKTTDNLSLLGANNQKNKFIEKGSICISCIATVGLVSITSERSQTNQQINSIVPNSEIFTEYLYLYFSQDTMNKKLKDLASGGSATLNLNTTAFSNITLLIPNNNLIEFFHKKVQPLFDKILSNKKESISLSDARDELLPKLLRGEIEL
ncbi:restriction endonuclease subunit S [Gallibacterium anatis]|uniref:restriction endonuclease subunit S n=1 Tax=Gallibacterium anatis TaxID=750 RepID=UPI000BA04A8C|nr:restriction endonuclease subunit S [Gallibacterium anatis]OZN48880.1 restriction endonuclease subunit S [Gallibacterium anatis]